MHLYLEGKMLMQSGDFLSALLKLREHVSQNETDLLALIDMACSYYMIGDYPSCQKFALIGLKEYRIQRSKLNQSDLEGVALGLGKILEEQGSIAEALEIYSSMTDFPTTEAVDKLKAHELRLLAELNHRETLPSKYIACESLRAKDMDREIDLQNALMEADFILFGPQTARIRMKRLVLNPHLKEFERRLLFFNYLYYVLRFQAGSEMEASLFNHFQYFNCDPFEKALWDLFNQNISSLDVSLSEQMSFMCAIRYLYLLQQRGVSGAIEKFNFYISSLSRDSRTLLHSALPIHQPQQIIVLSTQGILFNGSILNLGKSDYFLRVLRLLAMKSEIKTHDAIFSLYQMPEDTYSFDRLRVLVSRLNKKIHVLTGIEKFINMNKNEVRLNERIRLKLAS